MEKRITMKMTESERRWLDTATNAPHPSSTKTEVRAKIEAAWEAGEEVKPPIEWLDWVRNKAGEEGVVILHGPERTMVSFDGKNGKWYDACDLTLIRKYEGGKV